MNKKIYFLFVSLCIILCSCTIEKRLFQPGYHIEWKKKISEKNAEESAHLIVDSEKESDSITANPSSILTTTETSTNPENIPSTEIQTKQISTEIVHPDEPTHSASTNSSEDKTPNYISSKKKERDLIEETEPKQFEVIGIMSFGLYFSSIAIAIIGIILFNSGLVLIVAAFLLLLSLISGIISVSIYSHNKEKYYRNVFGYFGMIASMATITLGILLIALLFLAGSF